MLLFLKIGKKKKKKKKSNYSGEWPIPSVVHSYSLVKPLYILPIGGLVI